MSVSDFAFFGRLHPLILHLPIGLLLGALVLEVLASKGKVTRPALGLFLWLAALSAVVTSASGWVLSHEEGYGGETLEWHERLGIALAITAVLAALLHDPRARSPRRLGFYRTALVVGCVLLVLAGHKGSVLTHGADWLDGPRVRGELLPGNARLQPGSDSLPSPTENGTSQEKEPGWSPALPVEEPDTYAEVIAPFFAARCASCHGPTKHKGDLRLDSRAGLLAGGEDGAVLVPGDPAASLLFQRASLPLEHEDHMPPEGKPQPTPAELAALEAWIAAGAPFGDAAASPPAPAAPVAPEEEPAPPAAKPAGPPAEAIGALERAFLHHERVDPAAEDLWIDVAAVAPTLGDAEVRALLVPLAEWTVELSLARSVISDAALTDLARFAKLRRLDLRATQITDAGLAALAGHGALEELNLAQTQITDAAVEVLLGLPSLRKVALWNAGLSPAGLARLRTNLEVNAGDEPAAAALEVEGELAFTSDRALPGAELVPETLRPVNTTCPVSGSPVNPKYALVHTSATVTRVVGFCCPNCPKEFWADPAKFESKLP